MGSREGAKEIIGAIGDRLDAGYKILGRLEVDERRVGETVENGVRVIDTVESMETIY